jgi:hypothetical protein
VAAGRRYCRVHGHTQAQLPQVVRASDSIGLVLSVCQAGNSRAARYRYDGDDDQKLISVVNLETDRKTQYTGTNALGGVCRKRGHDLRYSTWRGGFQSDNS